MSVFLSLLMPQFDDAIVFKDTTAKEFVTAVKGKKVVGAKRWGKYFW
jgi:formamidopyrimidine-DNA glycosylase